MYVGSIKNIIVVKRFNMSEFEMESLESINPLRKSLDAMIVRINRLFLDLVLKNKFTIKSTL